MKILNVKVMKDYKVFNKVFIETLVDCPLKEEHHYEIVSITEKKEDEDIKVEDEEKPQKKTKNKSTAKRSKNSVVKGGKKQ